MLSNHSLSVTFGLVEVFYDNLYIVRGLPIIFYLFLQQQTDVRLKEMLQVKLFEKL